MTDIFKVRSSRKTPKKKSHPVDSEITPRNIKKMIQRVGEIHEKLDEVKPLYNELDRITYALIHVEKKRLLRYGLTIVDNFEHKNTQFKVAAISRYELKWLKKGYH